MGWVATSGERTKPSLDTIADAIPIRGPAPRQTKTRCSKLTAWKALGLDLEAGTKMPDEPIRSADRDGCEALLDLMETLKPDLIIYTSSQPSHDRAAAIPFLDFEVTA